MSNAPQYGVNQQTAAKMSPVKNIAESPNRNSNK